MKNMSIQPKKNNSTTCQPHKYQVTNHPGKKIRNVREHNSNKHKVDDG
jgi:hypothetical protein